MHAEWSAECSSEDSVLVVPWKDPIGKSAFVDLRANPYDFDSILEAEQHPPLMQALRALNAPRSPVFTAKCDAWPLGPEELAQLQFDLDLAAPAPAVSGPGASPAHDLSPAGERAGFASYIDLVWRDRSFFLSLPHHQQMLERLLRLAAPLHHPAAALDCVIRPAFIDLEGPREGYALSLYVKALGEDPQTAWAEWAAALDAIVGLIRSKELR